MYDWINAEAQIEENKETAYGSWENFEKVTGMSKADYWSSTMGYGLLWTKTHVVIGDINWDKRR